MIGALQLVESKTCADAHRQAVEGVLHRLKHNCTQDRSVLFLISGGTNLSVAVQALSEHGSTTPGLLPDWRGHSVCQSLAWVVRSDTACRNRDEFSYVYW